jgi:hypothetical protein
LTSWQEDGSEESKVHGVTRNVDCAMLGGIQAFPFFKKQELNYKGGEYKGTCWAKGSYEGLNYEEHNCAIEIRYDPDRKVLAASVEYSTFLRLTGKQTQKQPLSFQAGLTEMVNVLGGEALAPARFYNRQRV